MTYQASSTAALLAGTAVKIRGGGTDVLITCERFKDVNGGALVGQ